VLDVINVVLVNIDWLGSILALMGAFLLATNSRFSAYGWIFFLLSNTAWIIFSIREDNAPLLLMNIGFTLTSLLGLYRCFVAPIVAKYIDARLERRLIEHDQY